VSMSTLCYSFLRLISRHDRLFSSLSNTFIERVEVERLNARTRMLENGT